MTSRMAEARLRYRDAALNYWVALREKDSDRANDETAAGDELVRQWAGEGRAREFLEPMLHDADPEVRFAAASHLLGETGDDEALGVLTELQGESSMIGPTASKVTVLKPGTLIDRYGSDGGRFVRPPDFHSISLESLTTSGKARGPFTDPPYAT